MKLLCGFFHPFIYNFSRIYGMTQVNSTEFNSQLQKAENHCSWPPGLLDTIGYRSLIEDTNTIIIILLILLIIIIIIIIILMDSRQILETRPSKLSWTPSPSLQFHLCSFGDFWSVYNSIGWKSLEIWKKDAFVVQQNWGGTHFDHFLEAFNNTIGSYSLHSTKSPVSPFVAGLINLNFIQSFWEDFFFPK